MYGISSMYLDSEFLSTSIILFCLSKNISFKSFPSGLTQSLSWHTTYISLLTSLYFKIYNIIHFSFDTLGCNFKFLRLSLVSSDRVVESISSIRQGNNSPHIGYRSFNLNEILDVRNAISSSLISNTSLEKSALDLSIKSLKYTLIVISLFCESISDDYKS